MEGVWTSQAPSGYATGLPRPFAVHCLYASPVGNLISSHGVACHKFSDDIFSSRSTRLTPPLSVMFGQSPNKKYGGESSLYFRPIKVLAFL